MDQISLERSLKDLDLPKIIFLPSTGSTNDEAARLSLEGSPDWTIILADQQVSGRGRFDRKWLTPPGSALAFSLIFQIKESERSHLLFFSPLGALAVTDVLSIEHHLSPQIKWPNDVILNRRKVCGILAETSWLDGNPLAVILGIGINVASASLPPSDQVFFPATTVEDEIGHPVDRVKLLHDLIFSLQKWRNNLGSVTLIQEWEKRLAFMNEMVRISPIRGDSVEGVLQGLDREGNLRIMLQSGEVREFPAGDVHLRPMQDR